MEKIELFSNRKEKLSAVLLAIVLFTIHLGWYYDRYRKFVSSQYRYLSAEVQSVSKKSGRTGVYWLLKLKADGLPDFYTSYRGTSIKPGEIVRLQIFPSKKISFVDFMKGFYVRSRIVEKSGERKSLRYLLAKGIEAQHEDGRIASFYQAIFLALPMDRILREKISRLGISHLAALSGYHLGILWAMVYGFLFPFYSMLHKKRMPWRHSLFDMGIVCLFILGLYVWLTGTPHSLLRSYAMLLLAWVAILGGVELVSFQLLSTVALSLIVIFPHLLFSLGFWLSVSGVYYIYLLLRHYGAFDRKLLTILIIPVGIYILMVPLVHSIFETSSIWQILSPVLSLLFVLFYPVMLFMHFVGMGNLCDTCLSRLFDLPVEFHSSLIPVSVLIFYLMLSILAARYRLVMSATLVYALVVQIAILS